MGVELRGCRRFPRLNNLFHSNWEVLLLLAPSILSPGPSGGRKICNSWMDQKRPDTEPVCVMRTNFVFVAGKIISVIAPVPCPVATSLFQFFPSFDNSTL